MTPLAGAVALLRQGIADPDTQWSLGTFGAIAEFSRDEDEPAQVGMNAKVLSAITERGGIAIRPHPALRPFASESMTRTGWNHRVALCLSKDDGAMSGRNVLTEIGPDRDALREEDREGLLFDLGLGAPHADFCVRIGDAETATQLREHTGRPVFASGISAMDIILHANPHRVFISRLGRIEVYQPIPPPSGKSPEGPHTHVLPKLLRSGRTHPATEPIPEGWIPCAHIYPPHPLRDALGEPRRFDRERLDSFQQTMAACGDPETIAIKQRVIDAVRAGKPPQDMASDRHGRTSIRIALRQMKARGEASPALSAWLAELDQGIVGDNDDDALQHG